MSQNFGNLKKRAWLSAILKCVATGVSAGLSVVGVLLLILTLTGNSIPWGFYILIGLGCALVGGGLLFLFLRPTEMKVAKKYDEKFSLGEKLQTMVEYSGQEGDIVSLQREDAAEKLAAAPALKIEFRNIWQYIVCVVLAVCIFVSGVVVTALNARDAQTDNPSTDIGGDGPTDDPTDENKTYFEYDLYMQSDMATFISEVRDSAVEDSVKAYMVSELEALDGALKTITLRTKMLEAVYGTVWNIDVEIERTNSFRSLSAEIDGFDTNLAFGIRNGFMSYKDRIIKAMPYSYMKTLATGIGEYIMIGMEKFVTQSYEALCVSQMPEDNDEKNLGDTLNDFYAGMDGALTLSGVNAEDWLYESLSTLSDNMKSIKRQVDAGGTGDQLLFDRITECYGIMQTKAIDALAVQNYKAIMESYIRQQLAEILKMSFDGLAELYADLDYTVDNTPGDNNGDEGEDGPGHGGVGTGENLFGSDDLVYDPITGTMRKFGEIMTYYEGALQNGIINEDIPEYLRKYFENYYNYLLNGTGD